MRRIEPTIEVRVDEPWAYVTSPYSASFVEHVKQFPGREWVREKDAWKVPSELVSELELTKFYPGMDVRVVDGQQRDTYPSLNIDKLYPFQVDACRQIISQNFVGFLNFEMGLGKTPTAIRLLDAIDSRYGLIVCPAIVRLGWQDELRDWNFKRTVEVIDTGKKAKEAECTEFGVIITSYELLKHFEGRYFDAIVFDESHYIKNSKTARSKMAKKIRLAHPHAACLALTATPITAEPKDLHNQLDTLWPNRFGTFWQFVNRYSNVKTGTYGTEIKGINVLHSDELESRLEAVCCRVTRHEVAHLLPGSISQRIRIKSKKRWNQRELLDSLSSGAKRQHDLDTFCAEAGNEKFEKVLELVELAKENGATHRVIYTYHRDLAKRYAEELDCFYVDGSMSQKERKQCLQSALKQPSATVVATMKSVGIGINEFATFQYAVFAELYWTSDVVEQAAGRLNRINSTEPSLIQIPVLEGSLDEPIAYTLKRRLEDKKALMEQGLAEQQLLESFEVPQDEWLSELREAASSFQSEEYL